MAINPATETVNISVRAWNRLLYAHVNKPIKSFVLSTRGMDDTLIQITKYIIATKSR